MSTFVQHKNTETSIKADICDHGNGNLTFRKGGFEGCQVLNPLVTDPSARTTPFLTKGVSPSGQMCNFMGVAMQCDSSKILEKAVKKAEEGGAPTLQSLVKTAHLIGDDRSKMLKCGSTDSTQNASGCLWLHGTSSPGKKDSKSVKFSEEVASKNSFSELFLALGVGANNLLMNQVCTSTTEKEIKEQNDANFLAWAEEQEAREKFPAIPGVHHSSAIAGGPVTSFSHIDEQNACAGWGEIKTTTCL